MTYKVVSIGGGARDLETEMNNQAYYGWRVVSVTYCYDTAGFMITFVK